MTQTVDGRTPGVPPATAYPQVVPEASTEQQKMAVRAVYEELAGEYDVRIPGETPADDRFTATEMEFVLARAAATDHVLDMGCGTGRFTVPLAERAARVTAFDLSRSMLGVCEQKLRERSLSADIREGDMASLPFADESFDLVTSMLALMHIPVADRPAVFAQAARVLKPGGRLVIGVKNSVFERMFAGDRFATVDLTDVEHKQLIFTNTKAGKTFSAPWYSFAPDDITRLCASAGLQVVTLRGNTPLSVWLADEILRDARIAQLVTMAESFLGELPPFSHLGYYLLVEAVKLPATR